MLRHAFELTSKNVILTTDVHTTFTSDLETRFGRQTEKIQLMLGRWQPGNACQMSMLCCRCKTYVYVMCQPSGRRSPRCVFGRTGDTKFSPSNTSKYSSQLSNTAILRVFQAWQRCCSPIIATALPPPRRRTKHQQQSTFVHE